MKFSYSNPTQIQFGQGQIAAIKELIPLDQKVLITYGGGSIKKNGVYSQVAEALIEHTWFEFAGIEPNPSIETLDKAVEQVKKEKITFILAIGGGSVIDGSKYIAAASCFEGNGWDIVSGKHEITKAIPLGAILTLPATGSESNNGGVISCLETKEKLAFGSSFVQPKFAIMDPDVMKSLPERQLINGVVDAWIHTCEQYLTFDNKAYIHDGYALAILKSLYKLGNDFENRDDDVWRENLMLAANQALNGFIGAGVPNDWATHMLGHELTAYYGLDHARSLAVVQPSLLRNQIDNKRFKLEQIGTEVFGLPASGTLADQTIDAIEAFYNNLNVATSFNTYKESKAADIDHIISQLASHGMSSLGEHNAITLEKSRMILENSLI